MKKRPAHGPFRRLSPRHRRLGVALGLVVGPFVLAAAVGWLLWPYWSLRGQFDSSPYVQPSRLYESPPVIDLAQALSPTGLIEMLGTRGYRPTSGGQGLPIGRYRQVAPDQIEVALRSFPLARGWSRPVRLSVSFRGAYVRLIEADGQEVRSVWIDPLLLASYYGPERLDRWPEAVDRLPDHVVRAVLAAEDGSFFDHPGLSLRGLWRAVWTNVKSPGEGQGGSTLTQQLVKNLYLTPERSLPRKLREAAIALLLETSHSKQEILQAYINEIFLGRSDGLNLMGIGAASRDFFGVPASEMTLAEAATVAGVIQSPTRWSPRNDPERARSRRDWVLGRMVVLGWVTAAAAEQAHAQEIRLVDRRGAVETRYAADAAAMEVARRYSIEGLADRGFNLLSTLRERDQRAAVAAVEKGLEKLASGKRAAPKVGEPLQAALVSADTKTGSIRAWVGGRDYGESQFDRVRSAQRQIGSAFKPVVLVAALSERRVTLADRLLDEPLVVEQAGQTWSPNNDDRQFRGSVSLREAFEKSLNVPVARLALDVGLETVVRWARKLGVTSRLEPVPSVALGAFEMTPLELLGVYGTIAAGGRRAPLHLIDAVLNRSGEPVIGGALEETKQAIEPGVAYLVTSVLEGVVAEGTGRGLRTEGLGDRLAGKSGTTNSRRDSWFAGYSRDLVTVVWVGYDGAVATRLSGSTGALPIFAHYLAGVRPTEGFRAALMPPGVQTVTVDPLSGQIATESCPDPRVEYFLADQLPTERCYLHEIGLDPRYRERPWWRRIFKRRPVSPVG